MTDGDSSGEGHVRPRWVTAALFIGAVLALAVVLLAVLGGGGHGPGRHGL